MQLPWILPKLFDFDRMSTRQPSLSSHGALIALQEARKCYNLGQPSEVEVLHSVNLQVVPGEFVALIGPSG